MMVLFKALLYGMGPSVVAATIIRVTSYNLSRMITTQITNPNVKYWTQKYFDAGNFVVEKSVNTVGQFMKTTTNNKAAIKPKMPEE